MNRSAAPTVGYVGPAASADRLDTAAGLPVECLDAERVVTGTVSADIVVTEQCLEERSGLAVTRAVSDRTPDRPVVMFAHGTEALASDAITAGVTEYVSRSRHADPYETLADTVEACQPLEPERERRGRRSRRIDQLFENAMNGMALLDADGRYTYVNERHATLYGFEDPAAMLDTSWRERYGESELERFDAEIIPALEADGYWRGEAVGRRVDGSHFDQALSLVSLPDGGLGCIVRDVTARKRQRRELQRQNERLERFASVVSHDLRAPLQVAIGRLEAAQITSESEHLDHLDGALARMDALIEDVLTLAQDGTEVTDPEPVPIVEVSRAAWETVETGASDLTVTTDAVVSADRSRLRRVLVNLFRNAVEHGSTGPDSQARQDAVEQGGDDVAVRVGDLGDGGFFVADDGLGIPPDERDAVLDSGYTNSEAGTGYGLAIVDEIAAAHDWSLSVTESREGGARFEFRT